MPSPPVLNFVNIKSGKGDLAAFCRYKSLSGFSIFAYCDRYVLCTRYALQGKRGFIRTRCQQATYRMGSDGSAAGGGRSDLSEWPRSARDEGALSPRTFAGYRNRAIYRFCRQAKISSRRHIDISKIKLPFFVHLCYNRLIKQKEGCLCPEPATKHSLF